MSGQEPAPTAMPDAAALAAQFPGLPATEAFRRWQQYQAELDKAIQRKQLIDDARRRLAAIPKPKQWPATLNDFYRLIVRGKDETQNQPLFKRFLHYIVEKEQQEIRQQMERIPECERTDESAPSVFNTLRFRLLETEQAVEREVDRRFADYKQRTFQPSELPILDPYLPNEWTRLAREYQDWREVEKTSAKARAGRERAKKAAAARAAAAFAANPEAPPHKSRRKLTEAESLTKLTAAVEKQAAKEKRKKRPPLDKVNPDSAAAG